MNNAGTVTNVNRYANIILVIIGLFAVAFVFALIATKNNMQAREMLLWCAKAAGAVVTVLAGVLGLFSNEAFDKTTRTFTRLGWALIGAIIIGASMSFIAERIKAAQESEASTILLTQMKSTLDSVNRGVYPFRTPTFSWQFEINLDHPTMRVFASRIAALAAKLQREAPPFEGDDTGTSVGPYGEDAMYTRDDPKGRKFVLSTNNRQLMGQIIRPDDAFEKILEVDPAFGVFSSSDTEPIINNDSLTRAEYSAQLPSVTTMTNSSWNPPTVITKAKDAELSYFPKTNLRPALCFLEFYPNTFRKGIPYDTAGIRIAGLQDLAGKRIVVIYPRSPQSGSINNGEAMKLLKIRMIVEHREADFDGVEFTRAAHGGFDVYSFDSPPDWSVFSARFHPVND